MAQVLYVKANARPDGVSRTFRISEAFIAAYKGAHPQDTVTTLDLYQEGIQFLPCEGDLWEIHHPDPDTCSNHPILKYACRFLDADKYVFAAPLWNLGIPAILKAYIDYVVVAGITFRYTAEGPVGNCTGKKAVHITARGGYYSAGPFASYEMGDRYLRTILGFLGVADFATIAAEKLDVVGEDVEAIVQAAIRQAQETARSF